MEQGCIPVAAWGAQMLRTPAVVGMFGDFSEVFFFWLLSEMKTGLN